MVKISSIFVKPIRTISNITKWAFLVTLFKSIIMSEVKEIKVFTKKEAMEKMKVSSTTLHRMMKSGKIKGFKYIDKGKLYFTEDEINECIQKLSQSDD